MLESKEKRAQLRDKANTLPLCPGVYIMRDKAGKIIYVGKSRKLKNRVSQYFHDGEKGSKTSRMIEKVEDFDVILCENEIEALTLENTLIKRHAPKYNIKLKDSKSYPYIKVTVNEPYPRVLMSRKRDSDGARYFGPYSGTSVVYSIIDTLRKTLGLVSCKRSFPQDIGKGRPCIYKQMGQCVAPCAGGVTSEEYHALIRDAISILGGKTGEAKRSLTERMMRHAEAEQFESAARCRDSIAALDRLSARQVAVGDPDAEFDAIALYTDGLASCLSIFYVRGGAIIDKEDFFFPAEKIVELENISALICAIYSAREYIPREILFSENLEEQEYDLISDYLTRRARLLSGQPNHAKINVRTSKRGDARRLCDLVYENARLHCRHEQAQQEKDSSILIRLAQILSLEVVPERIEAYDISNLSGEHITAAMIVCEKGRLKRSDYRTFKIRSLSAPDDYAAMQEALLRRFARLSDKEGSFSVLPDLILLDGGRGHVSAAKTALAEAGFNLPVFGMIKDEHHKTRSLTDGAEEISIAREPAVFALIYKLQEEVHRFALTRMDKAKRKTLRRSILEDIPGIGPVKAKKLLLNFGSIGKIKTADEEALRRVGKLSQRDARAVVEYFANQEK